ncbi:MAG: hypothetical protein U0359_20215 [Byssovorax sp.]
MPIPSLSRASIRSSIGAALALSALLSASPSRADDTSAARRAAAAREQGRPYTMAEVSTGFLALPAAEVCLKSLTDCSRGELSLAFGLHNVYRIERFGLGAGIEWATTLRNDAARGAEDLERNHSRRYFLVEAVGRYYFIRSKAWEWWGGVRIGGVVINDSWSVKSDREPVYDSYTVGPRAATLGTEGLSAGAGVGGEWTFARNWSIGAKLQYASWFLPTERKTSPTVDVASLGGRVDMFDVGFLLAYRIAL